MLQKLLWKSNRKSTFIIAMIGLALGLFFSLVSIEIYVIAKQTLSQSGGGQFMVLQKPVSLLNTFGIKNDFSENEIEQLAAQENVASVGRFTSNQFKASISSDMAPFYSEVFFESVPSDFLDFDTRKFQWDKTEKVIPIVMPRTYLTLYNFGFAPSQNLPQFTEQTISQLPLNVNIRHQGQKLKFAGKIAGFSDRINSIIVPEEFLLWANEKYGTKKAKVNRLILKINNPNDKGFANYLKSKGFENGGGSFVNKELLTTVYGILAFILLIGLLLLLLSAVVLFLFFKLVITDSRFAINRLVELGHSPKDMLRFWKKKWLIAGGVTIAIVLVLWLIAKMVLRYFAADMNIDIALQPAWQTLALLLSVTVLLYFGLQRFMKKTLLKN